MDGLGGDQLGFTSWALPHFGNLVCGVCFLCAFVPSQVSLYLFFQKQLDGKFLVKFLLHILLMTMNVFLVLLSYFNQFLKDVFALLFPFPKILNNVFRLKKKIFDIYIFNFHKSLKNQYYLFLLVIITFPTPELPNLLNVLTRTWIIWKNELKRISSAGLLLFFFSLWLIC